MSTDMIIKPQAALASISTANTVSDAGLVYLYAPSTSVITIAGVVNGSFTIPAGETRIVEKEPTDTIAASAAVEATPIAYK
jgi:hypothetical protein